MALCGVQGQISSPRLTLEKLGILMEQGPSHPLAQPLRLHTETVVPAYIDYNGHMNVAFYVLIFDHASDALLAHVGLDEAYRNNSGQSIFAAEMHVNYVAEAMEGEDVAVESRVLKTDEKRLHLFHEMFAGQERRLVATNEVMILHVDLTTRRVTPFPHDLAERLKSLEQAHASLARPPNAGRFVGAPRQG